MNISEVSRGMKIEKGWKVLPLHSPWGQWDFSWGEWWLIWGVSVIKEYLETWWCSICGCCLWGYFRMKSACEFEWAPWGRSSPCDWPPSNQDRSEKTKTEEGCMCLSSPSWGTKSLCYLWLSGLWTPRLKLAALGFRPWAWDWELCHCLPWVQGFKS